MLAGRTILAQLRFGLLLLACAMAVPDRGAAAGEASGSEPLPFEQLFGGPFELVDHHGAVRTDRDFRGKFMLMYFGYTFCPSICPTNLQHMAEALFLLGDEGRDVVPVFVTLDPERDDRDVLARYVAHFGPRFVGLTGNEQQVRAIAKSYRVHRRKIVEAGTDPQDYLVDHASLTYLVGPDGGFLTLFPHNTAPGVLARTIRKYLSQS